MLEIIADNQLRLTADNKEFDYLAPQQQIKWVLKEGQIVRELIIDYAYLYLVGEPTFYCKQEFNDELWNYEVVLLNLPEPIEIHYLTQKSTWGLSIKLRGVTGGKNLPTLRKYVLESETPLVFVDQPIFADRPVVNHDPANSDVWREPVVTNNH